jgi:hypothetical protein
VRSVNNHARRRFLPCMSSVPADDYDHFMRRYSRQLAPLFADFANSAPAIDYKHIGSCWWS